MVATIEKNDVDLNKLFYYGDKFEIQGTRGKSKLTVYVRLVGDADLNRARVFALRKSAELRQSLKDKDSDIHMAMIPDTYEDLTTEQLIDLIAVYSMQDITRDAIKEANIPIPLEPSSDSSLEEQEKYQADVDDYPLKRNELIKTLVENKVKDLKAELSKKSKKILESTYESSMIKSMCEQEMLTKFREMCVCLGTYKDKDYTKPLFDSFDRFDNIQPTVKDQLLHAYLSLELSNDELKK